MARPLFVKAKITDLSDLEIHVQHLIRQIPLDGSTVDLQPLFFNQTLDTGTEFLLGQSVNSQTAQAHSKEEEFTEEFDYAQLQLQRRITLGPALPTYYNPKFNRACKTVHEYIDEHVARTIKARKDASRDPEKAQHQDRYVFLTEMAKQTLDPVTLRDELLNILLAARDTTAGLLSNTFHALARHPDVWAKLKAEIDELGGTPPDYETLRNMQYLKCVINEGLCSLCCHTDLTNRYSPASLALGTLKLPLRSAQYHPAARRWTRRQIPTLHPCRIAGDMESVQHPSTKRHLWS